MAYPMRRRKFLGRMAGGALSVLGAAVSGHLLGGPAIAAGAPCLRPPGALLEADFLAACIRCGRCADACPNGCIVAFTDKTAKAHATTPGPGQRNTPVIFPRQQACMLCNGVPGEELLCTAACPTGALEKLPKDLETIKSRVRMGTAEVDVNLCHSYNGASCGVCVRACPLEGLALVAGSWERPLVNSAYCTGCGLCERSCVRYPQAIRVRPRGAGAMAGTAP